MTNKELKKIAEKMSIVTAMMNEVQEILGKEDFEMSYQICLLLQVFLDFLLLHSSLL